MIHTRLLLLLLVTIPFLLAGCAGSKPRRTTKMEVTGGPPVEEYEPGPAIIPMDTTYEQGQQLRPDEVSDGRTVGGLLPDGSPAITTILFDFDSSDIRPDGTEILRLHSAYLLRRREAHVTLEGHGDERGTREYNLALGERRSTAVKQFLTAQGIEPGRLRVFSYGEERPIDPGQEETAWAKNRRVEILYY